MGQHSFDHCPLTPYQSSVLSPGVPTISQAFFNNRRRLDGSESTPTMTMEPNYGQDMTSSSSRIQYSSINVNTDQTMGGIDENISTTPTGNYSSGQQPRHQTSQSADFQSSHSRLSPQQETDRFPSPNMTYQQQPMQPVSRPSSGLSGSGDRYGSYSQTYQDQSQRPPQQASESSRTQSSVVIKVGMVGDAQIGKTSLMVKYVEGSWDEDYIQTLGMHLYRSRLDKTLTAPRCEFYGKDHLYTEHGDHLFNLGSWRPKGIRQYAASRLQRRCRHPIHV